MPRLGYARGDAGLIMCSRRFASTCSLAVVRIRDHGALCKCRGAHRKKEQTNKECNAAR